MRQDLPLGVIGAMLIHAAGESSTGSLEDGTFAIALAVADESELKAVLARLSKNGIALRAIYEPDPPYSGQLMAIGVRPAIRSSIRQFLSSIPLLRETRASRLMEDFAKAETVV